MTKAEIIEAYNSGKMVQFKWWCATSRTPRGDGNHAWGIWAYGTFQKVPTERKNWTEYLDRNWCAFYEERTFEEALESYREGYPESIESVAIADEF